jgi:uncharacterized protein (DUF302 family)
LGFLVRSESNIANSGFTSPEPPRDAETYPEEGEPMKGTINKPIKLSTVKLQAILQVKGVTVFALIDHSGEAAKMEWKCAHKACDLRRSQRRTPLMLAAPSIPLDLPIKLLIWEDD